MTKPKKNLSPAEIVAVLAQHDATLVKDLLAEVDVASAISKKGNNVELRKAGTRKALAENNKIVQTQVAEASDVMLSRGQRLAAAADSIMENGLDTEQAFQAMQAYVSGKLVVETQASIQDLVKSLVYRSMDLSMAEQGEEFPEQTNAVLDVPELGKRFSREGAGRKAATFDLEALRAAVGDEVFEKITAEKVVVTREVDEAALTAAVLADPSLLETVRDAVVPGDWKTTRLIVRDIPASDDNQE